MLKQKPGIERAIAYVRSYIGQAEPNKQLPSIRKFTLAARVSFVTMWKAMKALQESGDIILNEQGVYTGKVHEVNSAESVPEPPDQKLDSDSEVWENVTGKLYKDIVSGRFNSGEKLPSCKELQLYYRVSFATLKKALRKLVDEEIIEPRSNAYFIPSLTSSTSHARLVAIGSGWEDGRILVDYQDKNYFRLLESECIRMNLQLDVVVYYRENDRLQFVNTASKAIYDLSDRTIIGYVFIVANLESTPDEVLERLVPLRRTVAVLDVVGGWKIPRYAINNRFVQIFTATASVGPAKQVAHYLLSKGHNEVAFFSPFHKALWSQRRLETLIEMYNRAGYPQGVTAFVQNGYAYQWDYLKKQGHSEDIRSLIDQYGIWKKEAHSEFFKKFGNLGYSIVKYITEWNCASGEILEKMKPLFDRALDKKTVTAWVLANDFAATIAIDYLRERNIRVPEDLAVVSFDNTLDAMEYHLTSYDFNNQGIITMMLRFVLSPQSLRPAARKGGCIEINGTLVERRSTSGKKRVGAPKLEK